MKMEYVLCVVITALISGWGGFFIGQNTVEKTRIENINQTTEVQNTTQSYQQNNQAQETIVTPITNININYGKWTNYFRTNFSISNSSKSITNKEK
jgi:hypothetical protein